MIGVDIKEADVVADLSTPDGRRAAAEGCWPPATAPSPGRYWPPVSARVGAERPRLITEVNYFGVVELLEAWRPALADGDRAKVVVFSSNSTTTMPAVPGRAVQALLAGDADKALRSYRLFGRNASAMAYGASKIAVSRWLPATP